MALFEIIYPATEKLSIYSLSVLVYFFIGIYGLNG